MPGVRRYCRRWELSVQPNLFMPLPVPLSNVVAIIVHNLTVTMRTKVLQHADLKEDTDTCISLGGHGSHSGSVYKFGHNLQSLSRSLEDLDTDLKRPPVKCMLVFV